MTDYKYHVEDTQLGKVLFRTNDYRRACVFAFAEIDQRESRGINSEWVHVVDTERRTCVSMVI